jgi:hypothetical protein
MYAISEDTNEDKIVVIEDLKGVFGAKFDKDNNIVDEYFYKSNDEYKSYLENQDKYVIVNNNIDFNKVYEFMKTKEEITPHKVNPIYIKMIEANKNDKGSVEPRYQ